MLVTGTARGVMACAENVVGVHVRHGDKKTESAIIPIEQYLHAAKVVRAAAPHCAGLMCDCVRRPSCLS
jgi:hypothetical protein